MTGSGLWPSLLATWLTVTPVPVATPAPGVAPPAPPVLSILPDRRD